MDDDLPQETDNLCERLPGVVAFSAGRDSCGLVAMLLDEADFQDQPTEGLTLAHFNHGLDPSDDEGEACARRIADQFGLSLVVGKRDPSLDRPGESVQMNCRRQRYAFLERVAVDVNANWVATAHHSEDQLETLLMQIFRTSNIFSMKGIPAWRPLSPAHPEILLVRPALSVKPSSLQTYLKQWDIEPFEDPSNRNLDFQRNAIRHNVLPALRYAGFDLGSFDDIVQDVRTIEADLQEAAKHLIVESGPDQVVIDADPDRDSDLLVAAAAREAGHRLGVELGGDCERVARLMNEPSGPFHVRGGLVCQNDRFGRIVLRKSAAPVDDPIPAMNEFRSYASLDATNHRFRECTWAEHRLNLVEIPCYMDQPEQPPKWWVSIPKAVVKGELHVRPWQAGDRMRPFGLGGSKKLQDIFTDTKVPRWQRHRWPVVCDEEGILWLPGLCIDERTRHDKRDQKFLEISCYHESSDADTH